MKAPEKTTRTREGAADGSEGVAISGSSGLRHGRASPVLRRKAQGLGWRRPGGGTMARPLRRRGSGKSVEGAVLGVDLVARRCDESRRRDEGRRVVAWRSRPEWRCSEGRGWPEVLCRRGGGVWWRRKGHGGADGWIWSDGRGFGRFWGEWVAVVFRGGGGVAEGLGKKTCGVVLLGLKTR